LHCCTLWRPTERVSTLWPGPPHPRCLPLLRSYSPTPPCQTPRLLDLRPRCFWHAVWSCLVRHSARSQRWRALPTTHRQPCTQLTTGQQTAPSSATRASACAGQPPLDPASCISSCQACATSRPTASVLTVRGRAPALTDPLVYQPDGPGNHQESSEPPRAHWLARPCIYAFHRQHTGQSCPFPPLWTPSSFMLPYRSRY
jgi:hypothetical protein